MNAPLFKSSFTLAAAAADPASPALCPSDAPLVLLPVRLETRFFTLPDSAIELRIRVFPDKIHLDSHEPDLLPGERDWGAHYWEQDWRAGNDETARAVAWGQLVDRFGAARGGWIARVLTPTNAQQRPTAPVPGAQPLPVAPVFPAVPVVSDGKDSAWRRAPRAQLMPDRWIATLHSFAQPLLQATGRDIVRPLAVGPDPQKAASPTTPADGESVQVDEGMKWMVDFDAAEAAGMALRMTIPPAVMTNGIAFLFVFGVAKSLGPVDSASQLAGLLDAHHYTDGLEFLRYGTPTNNTDDRRAAAYADDPAHQRSYGIEVASDPSKFDATSNALRLGQALGLPADRIVPVLGHIGGAGDRHDQDMRSMNSAMWQASWGYYLSNMIGFQGTTQTPDGFIGNGMSLDTVAWAREHFVTHVRSFGPYPILRCGRQPYGVLPVTSLDLWVPRASEQPALARDVKMQGLLMKLRDNIWSARLGEALRLGRRWDPVDPDGDLADVMRTDGISNSYVTRSVFGRYYFQYLRAFFGEDVQARGFIATQDDFAGRLLMPLGIQWKSRTLRSVPADSVWRITAPLVQAGEVSPWTKLEPNYIAALLGPLKIDALIAARPDPAAASSTMSLLQLLLRHALLRELAEATARIAAGAPGTDVTALLRDSELIDLVTGAPPTLTWKRQLDLKVPGDPGNKTIRQFLEGLTTFDAPSVAGLGDFRRSLAYLQGLDSESLQYLLQGTLDLSAHRLDAWITSFATKRLASMRAAGSKGVYVGGFGWVENLRMAPPSTPVPVAEIPAGEQGQLVYPANDSGFIHAPSLTHASAAALLRNAHLGPTGVPAADGPFAIDLSSRRVREAERLLDGVRQGQPLGALLGYRVERSLHELGLDRFVDDLRDLAPLAKTAVDNAAGAIETIAANNVVDGLELNRRWQDDRNAVNAKLQAADATEMASLKIVLDSLSDAVDALSDALTAEAAYQIARGNTSRIASTLAAIARGDAPPPELEVARTPRTGTAATHRLLVLLSPTASSGNGWVQWSSSAPSFAEPTLNAWVAGLLGDSRKVRCTIERLDPITGSVAETRTLPLMELMLSPLDVVYGVEAVTGSAQLGDTLSTIEQRVLYHAKHKAGGFAVGATLRLQHARPTNLAVGELTLFDVLEQARAVRRLLSGARGADPEDLNPPERAGQGTLDLVDMEARVVRSENGLNAAHKQLIALIAKPTATTAEALRTALLKLGGYGVGPAVPTVASGEDATARSTLLAQAAALTKISAARLGQGTALRASPAAADPRARSRQLVERMKAVFGSGFVVLPRFSCGPGASELTSALAASKQAMGGDPLAANTWFARSARVRDTVARLGACLRGAEVLGTGERLAMTVAQLPFVNGERWVGLTPEPGKDLPAGKLSLVLKLGTATDPAKPMAGLWIDEWVEVVPSRSETTGLAFQFNPPDACAPQNVLIAVPPVPDEDWTVQKLDRVLMETLQLAKVRTADPETLGQLAQHLPALYFAFNAKDDVVSTDFAPLTR